MLCESISVSGYYHCVLITFILHKKENIDIKKSCTLMRHFYFANYINRVKKKRIPQRETRLLSRSIFNFVVSRCNVLQTKLHS